MATPVKNMIDPTGLQVPGFRLRSPLPFTIAGIPKIYIRGNFMQIHASRFQFPIINKCNARNTTPMRPWFLKMLYLRLRTLYWRDMNGRPNHGQLWPRTR